MKVYKSIAAVIATAFVMAMMVFASATPANAVGGNCSASKQEKEVTGLNQFRARAKCTSLQGDSKARPKLIRDGGPDYTGPYFTTLNKYYYTGWYTCYAGCSAAYEIAHV